MGELDSRADLRRKVLILQVQEVQATLVALEAWLSERSIPAEVVPIAHAASEWLAILLEVLKESGRSKARAEMLAREALAGFDRSMRLRVERIEAKLDEIAASLTQRLPGPRSLDERIVEALRAAPQSSEALAASIGEETGVVRVALQCLKTEGKIRAVAGRTRGTIWGCSPET